MWGKRDTDKKRKKEKRSTGQTFSVSTSLAWPLTDACSNLPNFLLSTMCLERGAGFSGTFINSETSKTTRQFHKQHK